MKPVIFYQYFSKKLKLKGVFMFDLFSNSSMLMNIIPFSTNLFLTLTVKYSSKV